MRKFWSGEEEREMLLAYHKGYSMQEVSDYLKQKGFFRSKKQIQSHLVDIRNKGIKLAIKKHRNAQIISMYNGGAQIKAIADLLDMSSKTVESVLYQGANKVQPKEQRCPNWETDPTRERTKKAKRLKKWRENHAK